MEEKDLEEAKKILDLMPYAEPFRFIDEISSVNEEGITGFYTFQSHSDFYKGHFPGFPLTPGVILTECMAQIGMVALGIHLIGTDTIDLENPVRFAFTSSEVKFLDMVLPGEKVKVESVKRLYRMGVLRCEVKLYNEAGKVAAEGKLAGYRLKS